MMMERLASKLRSEVLPDRPPKEVFLCALDSLEQFERELRSTSKHFGLLIVTDASGLADETLFDLAKTLISKGLVYLCTWGADCERVHDRFDDAELAKTLDAGDPPTQNDCSFMSTWHSNESLSEALWFFLHAAFAAQGYEQTCEDWIIAVIGNKEWESAVRGDVALQSPTNRLPKNSVP
jgi:hypothetical protein